MKLTIEIECTEKGPSLSSHLRFDASNVGDQAGLGYAIVALMAAKLKLMDYAKETILVLQEPANENIQIGMDTAQHIHERDSNWPFPKNLVGEIN